MSPRGACIRLRPPQFFAGQCSALPQGGIVLRISQAAQQMLDGTILPFWLGLRDEIGRAHV